MNIAISLTPAHSLENNYFIDILLQQEHPTVVGGSPQVYYRYGAGSYSSFAIPLSFFAPRAGRHATDHVCVSKIQFESRLQSLFSFRVSCAAEPGNDDCVRSEAIE